MEDIFWSGKGSLWCTTEKSKNVENKERKYWRLFEPERISKFRKKERKGKGKFGYRTGDLIELAKQVVDEKFKLDDADEVLSWCVLVTIIIFQLIQKRCVMWKR